MFAVYKSFLQVTHPQNGITKQMKVAENEVRSRAPTSVLVYGTFNLGSAL